MPPRHLVRRLAEEIRSVEQAVQRADPGTLRVPHFSTGIPALDRLLPEGGLRRGMLLEWLPASDDASSGTTLWALFTARAACWPKEAERQIPNLKSQIPNPFVIVDRHGTFYPPAAVGWGVPLASMILVRPANVRDEAWAIDQALRSPAVAAVLAWPSRLDGRAFRRLQLAVESSGTVGVLVRPASARQDPTWADVRLQVSPFSQSGPDGACSLSRSGWRFSIQCLHARASLQVREAVPVEIAPDGTIHEIPSKAARSLQSAI